MIKYKKKKKKENFVFFYLRTSTINVNFCGLPGAVDKKSFDVVVV
jgi:hypothetical protein